MSDRVRDRKGVAFAQIYANDYVRKVLETVLNALKVLATVSLDAELFFWVNGLKKNLEKKIEEAKKELEKK